MPRNLLVNGDLLLYGDVGDPWGWGDGFTPSDVAQALAEHGDGDLTVRINSGGGIATDGMAIYSLLKSHAGKVTAVIDGIAASAASLIAMAGAAREIRQGATMMIHDPSGITLGTEDTHRKAADKLGKLAESYAGVYATNSGKKKPDVRNLMKAETWLSADDAVAEGFATKTIEEAAAEKAAFDYRIYARAPRDLPVRMRASPQPAATAAIQEPAMKKEWAAAFYAAAESSGLPIASLNAIVAKHEKREEADAALALAVKAKKDADDIEARSRTDAAAAAKLDKPWAAAFYASASNSGLEIKALNAIVAKSATADAAKDALIDAMATAQNKDKPGAGGHVSVGAEARDKFVAGATKSIIAKASLFSEGGKPSKDGERNEFSQYTLRELARMSLEHAGVRVVMHDPMAMIGRAMAPVIMQGAMSTSDFTNILANVANKAMLKGYAESPETFDKWTGKGSLGDFKTAKRVDLGLFPSLAKVQEGAEYTYAKMTDRGVDIVLATYGKLFPITRQAIINDDLSAFTKIPSRMGMAARRTIGDLVYALLIANAAMPDSVALFHATHKNLQTSAALAAATLNSGRALMRKMPDPDNIKVGLNIKPAFGLCPTALEGAFLQLMNSQSEPGQENPGVSNRVAGMVEVVAEARLDADSATTWYLAGNPAQYDTIEVDYLNGVEAPVLEQKEGWNVDGVEFKVRMDAGVNLLDFRALQKSTA